MTINIVRAGLRLIGITFSLLCNILIKILIGWQAKSPCEAGPVAQASACGGSSLPGPQSTG